MDSVGEFFFVGAGRVLITKLLQGQMVDRVLRWVRSHRSWSWLWAFIYLGAIPVFGCIFASISDEFIMRRQNMSNF